MDRGEKLHLGRRHRKGCRCNDKALCRSFASAEEHGKLANISALGKQARRLEELTEEFSDPKRTAPKIAEILATLESLGLLQLEGGRYRLAR
ncbi:hypothetical protein [Thiorhodovibrio frisius]|uniref:hypothetical protein n=1 Tax=Thiorhodovibrio frisius TaxID=631362 RepID=UPI00167FA6A5|nr:hypothetical protein [Thiorhodovibrio frisius]